MRRRTKRTRILLRPLVLMALVINLAAGAMFSPVSAVRKVRVEGAPANDEGRLKRILQSLRGVPCARVNAKAIESEALRNPELRSANLARTPFGSAVLRVARRTPVARLFAAPGIGLSQEGVFYPASSLSKELPLVQLPDDYPKVGLSLGNAWRMTDVVRLAGLVGSLGAKDPVRIRLVRGGRLCLNIDSGVVDLGGYEQLDAKVAWLEKTLKDRPSLFTTVESINLVKLDAPTYQPRKGVPNL